MAQRSKNSLIGKFLALTLLLLTSGCGTMKLAYDYADWWVEYKLEQWVDLNSDQERTLQSGLGPYFKWHKSTIMPRIADSVSALVQAAENGKCVSLFDKQQELWNKLYQDTITKMTPIIAGVLSTLSSEQQLELEAGMKEDLEEAYERIEDPKKRTQKFVSRIEDVLGDLSDKQREFLNWQDPAAQNHDKLRMTCRVEHQKKLTLALKSKQSPAEIESILNDWWTQAGCSEDFQKHRDTMRQTWRTRMGQFEKSLNPDQKKSMVEELTTLKDNIRGIIQ